MEWQFVRALCIRNLPHCTRSKNKSAWQHHRKPCGNRATSSIFHLKKLSLNPETRYCIIMLQVQRGTGSVRHCRKNQHGKICNMSFGKLVTSILTNRHAGLRSAADLSLPCFLYHLMPVRASSTVYFLLLTQDSLIHHHYQREHKQPGMILPAEIHSIPCWTQKALGTIVGRGTSRGSIWLS